VILVLAHRYGELKPGAECSVVEAEYRVAIENKIPVLPFIVDDTHPWPPAFIDVKQLDALTRFKQLVRDSHTVKQFTTPDNLSKLVTESVAAFIARKTGIRLFRFPGGKYIVEVSERDVLEAKPDAVVDVHRSEDGLPLLLNIRRSGELESFFQELQYQKPNLENCFPDEVVDRLRASLADRKRIRQVLMADGTSESMYVSRTNLAMLFQSVFAAVVNECHKPESAIPARSRAAAARREADSDLSGLPLPPPPPSFSGPLDDKGADEFEKLFGARRTNAEAPLQQKRYEAPTSGVGLQSTAGRNRFLGLRLKHQGVHSVGLRGEQWMEWHPFISESLVAAFPKAQFTFLPDAGTEGTSGPIDVLSERMTEYAVAHLLVNESALSGDLWFTVARQSILEAFMRTLKVLDQYHTNQGLVHGDFKPSNVLFAEDGPQLVDSFALSPGSVAPGWSPRWSAPEVIMAMPVSVYSDIYSAGRVLADILGVHIVGEVRKFKTPPTDEGENEVDVFYNPAVFVAPDCGATGRLPWRSGGC
jgi:hypothetical protein